MFRRGAFKELTGYMFLMPAFLIFTSTIIASALMGFYYSFTDWDGVSNSANIVGLSNFSRMLKDSVFYIAVRNTLLITVLNVIFQNFVSIIVAVLLNKKLPGQNFFRTLFFVPSLLSTAIVGYLWSYILNPVVGSLRYILKSLDMEFLGRIDFLGNPKYALYTIIFVIAWQSFGYKMVIYIAGLQAIPKELYEAADIDGVNSWQRFAYITFPMLAPALTTCVFLTLVNTLRAFEHVYIMTKGGPGNTTETIATMIYNVAFKSNQMGYGTAVSTALYFFTVIVAVFQLSYMRKREVEL